MTADTIHLGTVEEFVCPKGHKHVGSLNLSGFGESVDGDYCMVCWAISISQNVARAWRST